MRQTQALPSSRLVLRPLLRCAKPRIIPINESAAKSAGKGTADDPEKLSAYECGFNAFDDARMKFDVRFYLVAILFIIFDLEVAFLFPWAVAFGKLGATGFWSMMVFLAVLTVGFAYEWKKGALEWD
jgi:NADH:ubiquinone oxidoreductase subunit 3 (subunit A)